MNVTMLGNSYSPYRYAYQPMSVDYVTAPGQSYITGSAPVQGATAQPASSTPATTEEKVKASQIISFLVDTTKDVTGIVNDIKSGGGSKEDQNAYKLALEAMAKAGNNPSLAQQSVANTPTKPNTTMLIGVGAVLVLGAMFMLSRKR